MNIQLQRISDQVFYSTHDHHADRPVLGYICGERFSLMVDGGNSRGHVEQFYQLLTDNGHSLPDYVVVTHWHWDHTFGLHACAGKTVACEKTNQKLHELSHWQWTDDAMKQRLASGEEIDFADEHIRVEYPDVQKIRVTATDIAFRGEMCFDLGGIRCRVFELPSPHSEDAVAVHVPEAAVVFVGDALSPDFYLNKRYDPKKLREMTDHLSALDFDICVTGHSEPFGKQAAMDYLSKVLQEIS